MPPQRRAATRLKLTFLLQLELLNHFLIGKREMPFFGVVGRIGEGENHALHVPGRVGEICAVHKANVMVLPSGDAVAAMRG